MCVMHEAAACTTQTDLGTRVLRLVQREKTCDTEALLNACTSYPWNEVFLEIDRLSRSGKKLCLFNKQDGDCAVKLPPAAWIGQNHHLIPSLG